MRVSVPSLLATQRLLPESAIPLGAPATETTSSIEFVAGSIDLTVSSSLLAIHTLLAPIAIALGPRPTGIAVCVPLASTRTTAFESASTSHELPKPCAAATEVALGPRARSRARYADRPRS